MKNKDKILNRARRTLELEAKAISDAREMLDSSFAEAVNAIYETKGRVVITGIGKSAIVGQKIVATFNSTGTKSLFMHAADAVHGDLGMIEEGDVVFCLSKSGNTQELKVLLPLVKSFGNKIIALVSNEQSYLAQNADHVISVPVEGEADPNDLAPTTSSTLHLAIGDAIAMSLIELREFSSEQFAKIHPGGSLGKQLYLRVKDVAVLNEPPIVQTDDTIRKTIIEITSKRLGVTAVLKDKALAGIITDGDLRRMLETKQDVSSLSAEEIMSNDPKTISADAFAVEAMAVMRKYSISQLLVIDESQYKGVVHIHDLVREGIV